MFSKTSAVAAALLALTQATELEQPWARGYQSKGLPSYAKPAYPEYEAPAAELSQSYGYGKAQSYGYPWAFRSFYRPRDVTVTTYRPVSNYWKTWEKPDEKINASCEFDFLGYSESTGRIELSQEPNDLTFLKGEFTGLTPGLHGLKVHEFGDLEYGCESTGDVFNPFKAPQGDSHEDVTLRRVGDIEQLQARWDLGGEYLCRDGMVQLSGPNSIIGRSLVLYEREDDHDRTEHPMIKGREGRYREGMGKRIACCVIGLAEGETPQQRAQPKDRHIPFTPVYTSHEPSFPKW